MVIGLDWLQWAVIACLLTLPIIYELNNTFKYYAKFALYYALVMLVGAAVTFYSLFRPGRPENSWFVNVINLEIYLRNCLHCTVRVVRSFDLLVDKRQMLCLGREQVKKIIQETYR
jgi:hypothetical protein